MKKILTTTAIVFSLTAMAPKKTEAGMLEGALIGAVIGAIVGGIYSLVASEPSQPVENGNDDEAHDEVAVEETSLKEGYEGSSAAVLSSFGE